MHYDVCILSDEESFSRMLYLELTDRGQRVAVVSSPDDLPTCALCFVDADRFPEFSANCRTVRYGRCVSPADPVGLHRPFPISEAVGFCEGHAVRRGILLPEGAAAVLLDGEHIPLSRLEYALISRLLAEQGSFVSRSTLFCEVFGGEGDEGIVNVYIHYLRKKLERDGIRRILALRGKGYAIQCAIQKEKNI